MNRKIGPVQELLRTLNRTDGPVRVGSGSDHGSEPNRGKPIPCALNPLLQESSGHVPLARWCQLRDNVITLWVHSNGHSSCSAMSPQSFRFSSNQGTQTMDVSYEKKENRRSTTGTEPLSETPEVVSTATTADIRPPPFMCAC